MRVKITLQYDGSHFQGFQIQNDGANTVANSLEVAFFSLGIKPSFHASGRTDSGVHATGQVIDIALPAHWSDLLRLKSYLNRLIAPRIRIIKIEPCAEGFHARFSAKKRVYRYLIKEGEPSVFHDAYLGFHERINMARIEEAIKCFEGVHDFAAFSKRGSEPKSTIREIYACRFYAYKGLYVFSFEANGYLRSQIRMMVDFLLKISDETLSIEDLKKQLEKQEEISRTLVKANGLYLVKVKY